MQKTETIKMPRRIYQQLLDHARHEYPLEACGLLAGRDAAVRVYYPMTNTDASGEHFMMDPKEQFAAVKAIRQTGRRLLAIFHSHPETPARLSDEDIRLALTPGVAHVILSLQQQHSPSIRAFDVNEHTISERQIEIVDHE